MSQKIKKNECGQPEVAAAAGGYITRDFREPTNLRSLSRSHASFKTQNVRICVTKEDDVFAK